MAQFFTDFSGYTLDVAPSDWTVRYRPLAHNVVEQDGSSRTYLRVARDSAETNSKPYLTSWDELGTPTDVEIFSLFQVKVTPANFARVACSYLRASGTVDNEQAYATVLNQDGSGVQSMRVQRIVGGDVFTTSGTVPFTWVLDGIYATRIRVSGTAIQTKVWEPAAPFTDPTADEPASWQADFTNSQITSGGWCGWGFITQNAGSSGVNLYGFGVGTGGDIAPHSAGTADPVVGRLAVPTGWTFAKSDGVRRLDGEWSAVTDAATYDYEVQRWDGTVWVPFASGSVTHPTTSFTLTGDDVVSYATRYRARVRAVPA